MDSNATTDHHLPAITTAHFNTSQLFSPLFNASLGRPVSVSLLSNKILAVTLNALALVLMLTKTSLQTPFNVYVLALMCSNVAFVAVDYTIVAVADAYGWLRLGNFVCTMRLYSLYILPSLIYHYHLLITLNRAWALFGPISYRARHNRTTAAVICVAVVVYVHLFMLPQVIRDDLYYRLPLEKGCRLNTARQFTWTEFTNILIYDAPCVSIFLAYPFLLWKMLSRRQIRPADSTNAEQRRLKGTQESLRRPFILLTLYTCSTMVCWLPTICYYTILSGYPTVQLGATFYQAQSILYNLQSILDPLFFCLTLGNVKNCDL
ncbi:muscarinic acetylcholine receptor M3-like [Paramacrobiotus metropolitanus]|uniref:muscarinic acetylcholine receptor M3-like n=1 Tax=Paramacrobiotus metropolitanus TaxID=2943436 RepID=UPI00244577CF|nr:muscarinic acetylcholine receptor M3-like [Paramacrobiotus metropolitanus]